MYVCDTNFGLPRIHRFGEQLEINRRSASVLVDEATFQALNITAMTSTCASYTSYTTPPNISAMHLFIDIVSNSSG